MCANNKTETGSFNHVRARDHATTVASALVDMLERGANVAEVTDYLRDELCDFAARVLSENRANPET